MTTSVKRLNESSLRPCRRCGRLVDQTYRQEPRQLCRRCLKHVGAY